MKTQAPKKPGLIMIVLAALTRPYTAGKWMKDRKMLDAAVVLTVSVCIAAAAMGAFLNWQYSRDAQQFKDVFHSLSQIFGSGLIRMNLWRGIFAAIFTIFSSWALIVCILSSWAAIEMSQSRQIFTGIFLGGFASIWLIPVTLHLMGIFAIVMTQDPAIISKYLSVCIALLPVTMLLWSMMSLRMAKGFGDAKREKIVRESCICEHCGYDLRATAFNSRCPECGEYAYKSISTIYRCNGWECGQWSYWRTWAIIIIRPDKFFRSVKAHDHIAQSRKFMAYNCLFSTLAIFFITTVSALTLPSYKFNLDSYLGSFTFIRACIGSVMWLYAAICMPILAATMIANAARRMNCPHANQMAIKISCYLSAFLVMLSSAITFFFILSGQIREMGYSYDKTGEILRLPVIITMTALFAWIWMVGVRGVKWLKWSNT